MAAALQDAPPAHVVVCGGGIVGASIAYHLATHPPTPGTLGHGGVRVTVVEAHEVACGASGKAGGFLAREWCNELTTASLAQKGYDMHAAFARTPGFDACDYRPLTTLSVALQRERSVASWSARHEQSKTRAHPSFVPPWIDGHLRAKEIGSTGNTAQVTPYKFTTALMATAQRLGVVLRKGTIENIVLEKDVAAPVGNSGTRGDSDGKHPGKTGEGQANISASRVAGVMVDGEVLAFDAVVVALGPWTHMACAWLPLSCEVIGRKAHSIVLNPSWAVSAHAIFISDAESDADPEIYPRGNGEVYVCGVAEQESKPPAPALVAPSPGACDSIHHAAARVCSQFAAEPRVREQACFVPASPDNLPVMGGVDGVRGAYVAAGHGCWGILMAPAVGLAMAELIMDGHAHSVDLSPFSLSRFRD